MIDRETRLAWLVDHAKRPRHQGRLPDADVRMPGGNPGCGDVVTLYLKAADGESRVAAVSFEGQGCTLSQAAASILVERVNRDRPSFADVLDMSYEEMIDLLGRDLVSSRPRCATLALGTLKAAVKAAETNRALKRAGHTDAEIQELRRGIAVEAARTGLVLGDAADEAGRG